MRIGLYNLYQKKLKQTLYSFTDTPFKGLIVGTIITGILQSSSAVMVLTIGLVATSYITFKQSLGIILGANIGTTFTTELITIDLTYAIFPLLILGVALLVQKRNNLFCIGCILFGLGCIFVAMNGFESLAGELANISFLGDAIHVANQYDLIGISIGTLLTALIQSSTATTGITMGFMNEGIILLSTGTAIVLGANIGTCITAFFASIGARHEAKLTAYAHIWLNILGVLLFLPFITELGEVATFFTSKPDVQLAHVSLIFNVLSSLVGILIITPFSTFILKIHGRKQI